jgi:4-hydroxy-3-polyprenylbenzoate decarboxylase
MSRNVVLAITGASGAPYAARLFEVLLTAGLDVHLSISPAGQAVLKQELGIEIDLQRFRPEILAGRVFEAPAPARIHYHHYHDLMAPIASGSFLTTGMVVCPCSGGTLSAIAHGASDNLIHRAAEVHLKERRKLILVTREAPLSLVHVDNMRRVTEAGGVVLPAAPGFYHAPATMGDLVDFVVARICDQLGVEHQLARRWGV